MSKAKKAIRRPIPGFSFGMSPKEACNYWFENRVEPDGWKCILAGGGNFSEPDIGTPVFKTLEDGTVTEKIFGYACGETGALLVRAHES